VIYLVFWLISIFGLAMALGTVLAKNLVHAALYLIAFFFVIACQFVMLEAEFLAAIQVLIYIGAVAILILFGIMLTRNVQGDETTTVLWPARIPAAVAGLCVVGGLVYGIGAQAGLHNQPAWSELAQRPTSAPAYDKSGKPLPSLRVRAINDMGRIVGNEMMTRFVIPFEVAGLLLTAALVGAIALAQLEGSEETPRPGTTTSAGVTTGGGTPPPGPESEPVLTPVSEAR